ncbi:Serine palmitoyltransferase 1 [Nosema granulosis]|uniref:serine C-palmitoyltransferase n=1 Tax=Nosema granulosis TaxID=83296 RepID=A0A9P6KYR3_9MICR|nr:Serine palmitoyltransferase 1 [Nosema granulosis]
MDTIKIIVQVIVIIMIFKFPYKTSTDIIELDENTVNKLIDEFQPDDLVEHLPPSQLLDRNYCLDFVDLSNYDAFNIKNNYKNDLKEIVKEYGIGTCGPPNFYGTLDLHIELESTIAQVLGTEKALIYSNYYSCLTSVISCFCHNNDRVFYQKTANEAILRGLYVSKARTFEFKSLDSLETMLEIFIKPNVRNYVVVEGLSKNTGAVLNLPLLLNLKKKYKFRIILDEAYSIPLVHKRGLSGHYNIDIREIDIVVGSFACGFPSNGGFFAGSKLVSEYQQISSSAYVFSASLPAVFTKFNMLAISQDYDCDRLRWLTSVFHKEFVSEHFKIVSKKISPIIIIAINEMKVDHLKEKNLLQCVYLAKHNLHSKKIYVGINKNPIPSIRVILKIDFLEKDVKELATLISKTCEDVYLN